MLRVLLTNDDGIRAGGLAALARRLARHCEVLVVAPEQPSSATSHCITLHKPLRLTAVEDFGGCEPATPRLVAYACSGTPSDCTMLGLLYLTNDKPVDLVISGINDGENVAQDLSYSGTVGAALEGAINGVPSLAVSQVGPTRLTFDESAVAVEILLATLLFHRIHPEGSELAAAWDQRNRQNKHEAVWQLPDAAAGILGEDGCYPTPADWLPPELSGTPCLNVNIPDLPVAEFHGIRWTVAGRREYRDVVQRTLDPRGKPYYWIAGEKIVLEDETAGTDTHALSMGYISVTPMSYDITNKPDLGRMKRWFRER